MPRQTEPQYGAGSATADPNGVDAAVQQLLGLKISNDEEVTSDTQIREQKIARMIALTRAKQDEHDAIRNTPMDFSFEAMEAVGVFFDNVALLLFNMRLHDNSEDIYSDLVYDKNMNDVKVWIWIWSGGDFRRTKERMKQFEENMNHSVTKATARNVYWDQVRVVWRISHMGQTWSREEAWWRSKCGQHQPLADFIRSLPQSALRLGWFQTEENLGKPVKPWLHSDFMKTWEAENPEHMNTVQEYEQSY
ncbi:hypothetical protein FHL15_002229 [Xylaria flabelliformis]|uniref:Uncharacterized protein n=1 Tax=Xylaria flabelliformis TaxID=2512241 RepID=A0A553I9P2_9PEZI|nr:hypothetical protein FHL15_002229 [Xylaria flabelliformis]